MKNSGRTDHEVKLRSMHKNVYWDPDDGVINNIRDHDGIIDVETLDTEQLKHLVRELDRRFIQLWDKVTYERTEKYKEKATTENQRPQ